MAAFNTAINTAPSSDALLQQPEPQTAHPEELWQVPLLMGRSPLYSTVHLGAVTRAPPGFRQAPPGLANWHIRTEEAEDDGSLEPIVQAVRCGGMSPSWCLSECGVRHIQVCLRLLHVCISCALQLPRRAYRSRAAGRRRRDDGARCMHRGA